MPESLINETKYITYMQLIIAGLNNRDQPIGQYLGFRSKQTADKPIL